MDTNKPHTINLENDSGPILEVVEQDSISYNKIFMEFAMKVAGRSEDYGTKVGCVITNTDNILLGFGFNAFSAGIKNLPKKDDGSIDSDTITHAEMNAVTHNSQVLHGQELLIFTTRIPCTRCMSVLCQFQVLAIFYATSAGKKEDERYSGTLSICKKTGIPLLHYNSFFRRHLDTESVLGIERKLSKQTLEHENEDQYVDEEVRKRIFQVLKLKYTGKEKNEESETDSKEVVYHRCSMKRSTSNN